MTKELEKILNLPPLEVDSNGIVEQESVPEEILEESTNIINALSTAEKVDNALTTVVDLDEHDREMDDIAQKAIDSYEELLKLGQNVADPHAGRIFEVAATMLKTALEAKDAKANRKLRMIELQLKKIKLETGTDSEDNTGNQTKFDRNDILKMIYEKSRKNDAKNNEESDK